MRLVTVNLYNGRVVSDDFGRFLDRVDPDIVCAQEVGHDAARILRRRFVEGAVEGGSDHEGRAMVGKLPLSVTPLPLSFRGGYRGQVELLGRPLEIIGVHLANPIDGLQGVPARRRQLAEIDVAVTTPGDRVLVGDLNATSRWPAYRRLLEHFDDGVADWAHRRGVSPAPTWAKYPSWPAMLRIDHVLTSGILVTNAEVERIEGLDHRALVVDLAWHDTLPAAPAEP